MPFGTVAWQLGPHRVPEDAPSSTRLLAACGAPEIVVHDRRRVLPSRAA